MSSVAGTRLGRYKLLKHLTKGAAADLLLARSNGKGGFERHVVIKRLRDEQARDADLVDLFLTEARLAAALHHHNIIQVHDVGEQDGKPYLAMEYIHGEDLSALLARLHARGEQLPLHHILTIVSSVAAALHHVHEQRGSDSRPLGIVHRALTPSNILVAYDGNVKIMDFGIAKAATSRIHTQVGVRRGKVSYMAPEQCMGNPADRRSDVFSLGIVLYELVTARRLFKSDTELHTMTAIISGTIPRPSLHRKDLPAALEKIVLKALACEPADRYQTADELCVALEELAKATGFITSVVGLAGYMKDVFGERPEPWLVEGEPADTTSVDFDGSANGLVQPATGAIENVASAEPSPIVNAQLPALAGKPTTAALPRPGVVAASPKPLPRPSAGRAAREVKTEVVVPLPTPGSEPSEPTVAEVLPPPPPLDVQTWPVPKVSVRRRRWVAGGVIAIAACGAIVAVIGRSGSHDAPPAAAATPRGPDPTPNLTSAPSGADKPWEQMTMRDYEHARATATIDAGAAALSVDKPVEPVALATDQLPQPTPLPQMTPPVPDEQPARPPMKHAPEPAKRAPPAPKPASTVAAKLGSKPEHPPMKTAKSSAPQTPKSTKPPPKWDPDSLLPRK